ncbi:D-glycero-beta-D-manno-heptose-7-phosphate kinase [Campylobacter sp. RM16192]|uniref:D-glycero-beta-D-manno-heptose-7-phosphate kinase n=1 Tax=Campylobacter sp. RM16192 TaxID=1660080 RepID=UPI0014516263|nr:D-glycero-beta-D-manno-heptose-7-phosphate kinase [Campylobacter sp. RM16192]QCD52061.1 D,D-heptose 1-phosphate adenosyltransferase / 7-phosphate kinase [Campylobacter sp. RM16192]
MREVRVLVVGDLMLDHYIWGSCDRISPEAPVQVVKIKNETKRLGGAGNVVLNLLSLGTKVGVISVVGADEVGEEIIEILEKFGAKVEFIKRESSRISSIKSRVMATHQQVVRIDKESAEDIDCEDEVIAKFKENLKNYDVVLLSDYGKGVLTPRICNELINLANLAGISVLADPKGKNYSKYKNATLITPNKKEASEAVGFAIDSDESLEKAIKKLKDELNLKYSVITISEEGIALLKDDKAVKFPALAKEVFDVTGAGDTVLATLGYMLGLNDDIQKAIETANLAAAVVVAKVGSATASFEEINELVRRRTSVGFENKIKSLDELKEVLVNRGKKRLVFTNGCFDILHKGHAKYLAKAREFGDILVVGLNSDRSVRELKGESRPINSEDDRAFILAALGVVDYVVIFDELTPINLISALKPDILVKGADYEGKEVVGSNIVSDVRLVEFVEGKSTTNLVNRIQNANR